MDWKRAGQRVGAFAFSVLLIGALFTGAMGGMFGSGVQEVAEDTSPVGDAEAIVCGGFCIAGVAGAGIATIGYAAYEHYVDEDETQQAVNEALNEIEAANANETEAEIHSKAGQLSASNEQFLAVMSNYNSDSDTVAFSKGEAAAVEALANGGTVSEAQQAANESISDYYTTKQANLIDRWNVVAETVITAHNKSVTTTGVSSNFVSIGGESSDGIINQSYHGWTTVSLANGTEIQVREIGLSRQDGGGSTSVWFGDLEQTDGLTEYPQWHAMEGSYDRFYGHFIRANSTQELTSTQFVDAVEYNSTWTDVQNDLDARQTEVSVYVNDSLGPAMDSGTLNATSYVSPSTLAQEYALEYGNDSGYIQAMATAAAMGYSTPTLDTTASMTISYEQDGQMLKHTGMLLSQNAPDGGAWESGETYDPALIEGKQFFAVAGASGDEQRLIDLQNSFTVTKIQNAEEEEIAQATTFNIKYQTPNASADYAEQQQKIRNLTTQIAELKASIGTTDGTDSGGSPLENLGTAGIIGLALAAALLMKENGP